jgi:hypothetical protein
MRRPLLQLQIGSFLIYTFKKCNMILPPRMRHCAAATEPQGLPGAGKPLVLANGYPEFLSDAAAIAEPRKRTRSRTATGLIEQ